MLWTLGEGPSRGLLRDYEPSDRTFSSTSEGLAVHRDAGHQSAHRPLRGRRGQAAGEGAGAPGGQGAAPAGRLHRNLPPFLFPAHSHFLTRTINTSYTYIDNHSWLGHHVLTDSSKTTLISYCPLTVNNKLLLFLSCSNAHV